jgi:hypothetical protein
VVIKREGTILIQNVGEERKENGKLLKVINNEFWELCLTMPILVKDLRILGSGFPNHL